MGLQYVVFSYLSQIGKLHDDPYGGHRTNAHELDDVRMVKLLHDVCKNGNEMSGFSIFSSVRCRINCSTC